MYFETGQGSALSADAHHGCDQQTIEARAYAVARQFKPLLVNSVVGFIGPEYLFNGKQIIRAGLEDHFCAKLLGLPMGCDICYTNHAEADQNDMDVLLTLLGVAGCSFIMGIPGSDDVMYFETGQGSALSAGAHHGVDQQTVEVRAYAVARAFSPFLINTVVGFIGPEYLYDGKQIIRAGLEDHLCGRLLGLPMGVDVCYTNHAEADQNDMDTLLTALGVARCPFVITVPGADDVMLGYQSLSFHDAHYIREVLGLRPAPEFESWLDGVGLLDARGHVLEASPVHFPVDQLVGGLPGTGAPL
jgi:ethanolamine ammonia-lyase large subunit